MNELEELTKKFLLVDMDDVQISTDEKPIIGTQALITCTGLLLYCEEKKIAIVAHISAKTENIANTILDLLDENNIKFSKIKYMIIPGENSKVATLLINLLRFGNIERMLYNDFFEFPNVVKSNKTNIQIDKNTSSKQFAFNSLTGEFVTNKVLFGLDYLLINPPSNIDDSVNHRHFR